jgi:immunity protein, SdpI family
MTRLSQWRYRVVIGIGYVASLAGYSRLPTTHYELGAYSFVAMPLIAGLLPTSAAVMAASVRAIWRGDPIRDPDGEFEPTYDAILFAVVAFVISIHLLVVGTLTGTLPPGTWLARGTIVLFGLVVVRIGNLLPRTRPNLALGIRTPRTLADRRVWMQTHRTAGYLSVMLGTVIVIAGASLSKDAMPPVIGPATLAAAGLLIVFHYKHAHQ